MSKVLRRPLFRGGPVDPRGTGITSGLDDGRVRKQTGGGFTYYDTLGINKPYLVSQRPYFVPNMFGGKGYQVSRGPIYEGPSSMADMSLSELLQSQLAEKGDVFYKPESEIKNLSVGAPELTEDELYNYRLKQQKVKDTQEKVKDSYDKYSREAVDNNNLYASLNNMTTDGRYVDDIEKVADEGKALRAVDTGGLNTFENLAIKAREEARARADETEISKDDLEAIFAEPLKKARRRDIGDILGGAAEGFLTGGLREGLIGATRAAKGPGRTEQIENAIASLKAQSKLLEGKEKRAFANEIKKLEKIKELGLGKTGQETDYSRSMKIMDNPELYPPEIVAAAKRKLGGYGSIYERYKANEKNFTSVPEKDFINLVREQEGENFKAVIDPEKLNAFLSAGPADGVYVIAGQKKVIFIEDGKINPNKTLEL